MNLRQALLTATLLGLLAGCSRNATQPPTAEPSGTATQPMETPDNPPAPADAPVDGPSGGSPSAALPQGPGIFMLKGSGVRCMTTPCPTHVLSFPDTPGREPLQIHEVDLSGLGLSEEQQAQLMLQVDSGQEVRVKGALSVRAKAGPAGDATVLRVLAVGQDAK